LLEAPSRYVRRDRVAFAWALLRCGTQEELEEAPERRLRLTLGLEKVSGEWSIIREHHSFTIAS
jgi:ketosteroid isomerase-like protein